MSQRKQTRTRTLAQRPHLDQLRRQAKELLEAQDAAANPLSITTI